MNNFVSLNNYTHYSLLNSLLSPKDLLLKAKELGQPAVAITDYGSLAGAWDAFKASKEVGIKLIIGCEFYFVNNVQNIEERVSHIVLLAKNAVGYKNILLLNKLGFDNSFTVAKKVIPIIDWDLLQKHSDSVICLTGGGDGVIGQLLNNKKFEEAESSLKRLQSIFGDNLGVEVQPHTLVKNATFYNDKINQTFTNFHLIRLAKELGIRIVPSCSAKYLTKEDAGVHDVLLAIGSMQPVYSNARVKYNVPDFYLKSREEVEVFFARLYDIKYGDGFAKSICDNTIYFADLCEEPVWIDPKHSNPTGKELPVFPVQDELDYNDYLKWIKVQPERIKLLDEDNSYLRFRCFKVFDSLVPKDKYDIYLKRMEEELDVLYYCGVGSYMLIVADYISWAKNNHVSVGPGRGSVGGCLVAYLLGIHMADPIKYGLVFERFHNKLKRSYSDIDTDFSKLGRDRVIEYITDKYGKDNVAQISNLIEIKPKVFARDISRSCELGGSRQNAVKIGDDIANSIPKKVGDNDVTTFDQAYDSSPLFSEYCKKYTELKKYSSICNKYRSFGIHASGIVISKRSLSGLIPLRKDKDNNMSLEYDKDAAEENGLVKMDFLGLSTLDIIDETNKLIKQYGKEVPKINYDEYDQKTYDLISSGDTFGVFQFGISAGTIDLCKKIKPKNIEDLAIITTIARPASRAFRGDFIKVREGKKVMTLMHNLLENALAPTFGFSIYDESLLVLAKDIAGWDLGEADKLRKLTKEKGKNPKKVLQWRNEFIDGATKNGIRQDTAMNIWDKIVEPFGRYSFNKSHAVEYSMLSYHTAYLKAHFPIEFLLANLMYELKSNTPDAEENVEKIKNEIKKHKIKILPPDINKSESTYKLIDNNTILTGLDALKFVGDDAICDILLNRPFKNFEDFMIRSDTRKVSSGTIKSLAASGCFDNFGISRKLICLYCSDFRKKLQVWLKRHNPSIEIFSYPWPVEKDWIVSEKYALEKKYLGEAFICGKAEAYGNFFRFGMSDKISTIKMFEDKTQLSSIKAEVKNIYEFKVKKEKSKYFGQPMIKAIIEDEYGEQCPLTIFPDKWKMVKDKVKEMYGNKYKFDSGLAIHFAGTVNIYEDNFGIILENLYNCAPPPSIPKNMESKKVSMKKDKKDKEISEIVDIYNSDKSIEMIEDALINEGLIDLSDEDQ